MDSKRFDDLSKELLNSSDRRRVIQGVGTAAVAGLAALALGRTALADNGPRNDDVRKRCVARCQKHTNRNNRNCHRQCRRVRGN